MSIGSTIKRLRREREMTQEQLADLLGITANAVSQWECDRTAPDISQLPMLSSVFRVSADVILGIDIGTKDTQIEKIYDEVRDLWCKGHREEAERLCREGLNKFPDAYILMEELAFNLSYSIERAAQEECITLFERIRAGSNNEHSKNFAIGNLCSLYMAIGETETAKQLAETVSQPIYTREECRLMTLRGAEWADEKRRHTAISFDKFIWDLRNLMSVFKNGHPIFCDEELLALWQKIIDFVKIFYEDRDFGFDEQLLIEAHFNRAVLYIRQGETESALSELCHMTAHIENYDRYSEGLLGSHIILPKDKWPSSILVRPRDENDGRLAMSNSSPSTENAAMEYLRQLSHNSFDSLRNNPKFCEIEHKLKNTAHE